MLRCGAHDLDIEGPAPGLPTYQELLYEADRFELGPGSASRSRRRRTSSRFAHAHASDSRDPDHAARAREPASLEAKSDHLGTKHEIAGYALAMQRRAQTALVGAAAAVGLLFLCWVLAFHVGFAARADASILNGFVESRPGRERKSRTSSRTYAIRTRTCTSRRCR